MPNMLFIQKTKFEKTKKKSQDLFRLDRTILGLIEVHKVSMYRYVK